MEYAVTPVARGADEWEMQVLWLDPDDLVPNAENPNEQTDAEFNALCRSIQQEGWTGNPVNAVWDDARGKYEIVAGEHRWRAARVLGSKVPVIPLPPEQFDRDRRDWNVVKDNMIKGRLNPEKFTAMYNRLAEKYDREVLVTLMGFTNEDAFKKVYQEVKRALPPGLAEAMEKSKDEIRTIDDLSSVLNRLFRDHGETLDSNYMTFSWGGKEILWVRADKRLWKIASAIAERAHEEHADAAQVFADLLDSGTAEYVARERDEPAGASLVP